MKAKSGNELLLLPSNSHELCFDTSEFTKVSKNPILITFCESLKILFNFRKISQSTNFCTQIEMQARWKFSETTWAFT